VRGAIFDPDLEQGGNANVVVRRDSTTGEVTRCSPADGSAASTPDENSAARRVPLIRVSVAG
jgi:hypothetical protein